MSPSRENVRLSVQRLGLTVTVLGDPLIQSLKSTPDDSLLPTRLDAAIRALAPAATVDICVSTSAHDLLTVLLATQCRSLLTGEDNTMDDRGTHTLVSARALLTLAQHGDDTAIYQHIDAYADNPALLGNLLRTLSAQRRKTQAGQRRHDEYGRVLFTTFST